MLLDLPNALGMQPFQPRAPWLTSDLQTLRDSLRPVALPPDTGTPLPIPVAGGDQLLALLDRPLHGREPLGLVLLMHGLGGSSEREGLRRMGLTLQHAGFAVLRLAPAHVAFRGDGTVGFEGFEGFYPLSLPISARPGVLGYMPPEVARAIKEKHGGVMPVNPDIRSGPRT